MSKLKERDYHLKDFNFFMTLYIIKSNIDKQTVQLF